MFPPDGVPSIDAFARRFPSFRNILVLSGAGLSTAAGIPVRAFTTLQHYRRVTAPTHVHPQDFRTPGTGLYAALGQYNLPTPESLFDIECARRAMHLALLAVDVVQLLQTRPRASLRFLSQPRHRHAAGGAHRAPCHFNANAA